MDKIILFTIFNLWVSYVDKTVFIFLLYFLLLIITISSFLSSFFLLLLVHIFVYLIFISFICMKLMYIWIILCTILCPDETKIKLIFSKSCILSRIIWWILWFLDSWYYMLITYVFYYNFLHPVFSYIFIHNRFLYLSSFIFMRFYYYRIDTFFMGH